MQKFNIQTSCITRSAFPVSNPTCRVPPIQVEWRTRWFSWWVQTPSVKLISLHFARVSFRPGLEIYWKNKRRDKRERKKKARGVEKGTGRGWSDGDDRTNHAPCQLQINQRSFSLVSHFPDIYVRISFTLIHMRAVYLMNRRNLIDSISSAEFNILYSL